MILNFNEICMNKFYIDELQTYIIAYFIKIVGTLQKINLHIYTFLSTST